MKKLLLFLSLCISFQIGAYELNDQLTNVSLIKSKHYDKMFNTAEYSHQASRERHRRRTVKNKKHTFIKGSRRHTNNHRSAQKGYKVYITPTGECYHSTSSCPTLWRGNYSAIYLRNAKGQGYRACQRCN